MEPQTVYVIVDRGPYGGGRRGEFGIYAKEEHAKAAAGPCQTVEPQTRTTNMHVISECTFIYQVWEMDYTRPYKCLSCHTTQKSADRHREWLKDNNSDGLYKTIPAALQGPRK